MLRITWSCIVLVCCSFTLHALNLNATSSSSSSSKILVHPHQHPDPQAVVHDVNRRVNESVTRRQLLVVQVRDQCLTGNPIDDCWRCDPNWELNREHLADCAIGFGREALGGRGGNVYVVTDPSDPDPENPPPGTLRYGVVQAGPLWIIFSGNMVIKLRYELLISSFKTIDGRGANVHITGLGCLIIYDVTNIIIHNVHIHHCKPSGNAKIRISPTQVTERGRSDGDGISVLASSKIWIDHCFLSYCTDGLIDVTEGSTAVTLSNNMFAHHDKVMLLGHSDDFTADSGMQVTVAFNHFGDDLKERMPRCRFGYFHVVNNDYTQWGMYAVGGSSHPTINSQGNRYLAPQDNNNKEVTKRMDTDESEWRKWNWRSEGDLMVNGAFFVTSGADMSPQYAEASSMSPLSASYIDQLTATAGVLVEQSRSDAGTVTNPSSGGGIVTNPAAPGSSGGGVVTNPAAPGSSGGTVTNPVSSGGDGSSGYPGQGSTGTITGTSCWYTDNGIDYGSIYNSEARTPLVPMTSVILSVIAIVAFLHRTCS
ncbi:probable pectate lyase 5 isoform X1 [Eucalyptus grandis]|uniref:probable pectate lyase 5 isoform X1 n=1 Tax=Eucalyptus grandis TaxID=71139 RepID=UPI00052681CF|nr:probable pectate lyase 5 isoform X1 [Eucalyptus grandis]